MPTIMPEGELLRRAVKWICEQFDTDVVRPTPQIMDQAAVRFNLGPADQEALDRFFKQQASEEGGPA